MIEACSSPNSPIRVIIAGDSRSATVGTNVIVTVHDPPAGSAGSRQVNGPEKS